jgi:acyl-CoA synthetase (AMP-forming)/AMP-acid ligase II
MPELLGAMYGHAATRPTAPALLVVGAKRYRQFAYADLGAETDRWAARFASLRFEPDAIVAIVLEHRYELYPAFLGAMRAGAIPTFLPFPTPKQDPVLYWKGQRELFARVRPACVVAESALAGPLGALCPPPCIVLDVDVPWEAPPVALPPLEAVERPERIALLQHSSGTTGAKKGVALTYRAIAMHNAAAAHALEARTSDLTVSWLPLYHDMGLIAAFLLPIWIGSSVVSLDAFEWLLSPASLLETIEHYRATHAWLPNFAFEHLVRTHDADRTYDLRSMRAFVDCSEPCKPGTFARFAATFAASGVTPDMLRTCYAMAETVFAVTLGLPHEPARTLAVDAGALRSRNALAPAGADAAEFLSCGRPLAGVEIRILAAEGEDVGEIVLRSPYLFSEYHRNPEATADAFVDGWYGTGDLGFVRDGELFVCGRRKEMLVVHGRNFYSNDIEAAVNEVEGVKPGRVAVFGRFDDATGSEEAVVLAESEEEDEARKLVLVRQIRSQVYSVLGLQVRTVEIRRVGELIKTTSGKISRDENERRFADAALGVS